MFEFLNTMIKELLYGIYEADGGKLNDQVAHLLQYMVVTGDKNRFIYFVSSEHARICIPPQCAYAGMTPSEVYEMLHSTFKLHQEATHKPTVDKIRDQLC